mgnify:CR=1 FL=1
MASDGGFINRIVTMTRSGTSTIAREFAKFGIIGFVNYFVDVGLFNLLQYSSHLGVFENQPIRAKIVSTAIATTLAYFANRFWTFRHRARTNMGREYVMFFLLNGIAMLIAVACLGFSHYVLGLTSPLADNISANVIGLGLGTLFRFWSYRKWVFPSLPQDPAAEELAERDAITPI